MFEKVSLGIKTSIQYFQKRFANSFNNSVKQIKENPFRYQIRYDEIRVVLLKTFPYLIHFSIDNEIIVIKLFFIHRETAKSTKYFNCKSNEKKHTTFNFGEIQKLET